MTLLTLMNRNCAIVRRSASGSTDDYGNSTNDETLIAALCEVQQIRRQEPGTEGELSDTLWNGYFPIGTTLGTDDAVEVEGLGRFELVGAPWVADSGSSAVWHVEATLRKTAGAEDVDHLYLPFNLSDDTYPA